MEPRTYQIELESRITDAWSNGYKNVLAVMPTGTGKTVVFSHLLSQHRGGACVIAHRQELVSQISLALSQFSVCHKIIAPLGIIKYCCARNLAEHGKSFYSPEAPIAVAGVDTLIRRELGSWGRTVSMWVMDEAHHIQQKNKWGRAVSMFPNARGLGVTATPCRCDKRGLSRSSDSVFDKLVIGPNMRSLINRGYLTDYLIYAPPTTLDLSSVRIATDGDYARPGLATVMKSSPIVGDVVQHYERHAAGKRGVTFAPSVELAEKLAKAFQARGIPAAAISAETPASRRQMLIDDLRHGRILQLVNVDIFGEGFDLPAIECVSMARPTMSYPLYVQQFGRSLRPIDGKSCAVILDHVGNVVRHGLPETRTIWSLEPGRGQRETNDPALALQVCEECFRVRARYLRVCPYCGYTPIPSPRSTIKTVDGDLTLLDIEALRGQTAVVDMPENAYREYLINAGCPRAGIAANIIRHREHQAAQRKLRETMAWWGGYRRYEGATDGDIYRMFYLRYGIDMISAQKLALNETIELAKRII